MEALRTFKDIDVKLVGAISTPYELAVATARTCYSGKGVILPSEVSKDAKAISLRDRIAESTLDAGHLTTRQHAHFVFAVSGVSRQFIWNFLHSHPYYNSEQVSQRYVKVKRENFVTPELPEWAQSHFRECVSTQMDAYEKLITVLRPIIRKEYFERFRGRVKEADKWENIVDKRTYEVARYVLPVAATAYLYHTVSALTLLRYARLCDLFDTPQEQRIVIHQMLDAVRALDPLFGKEVPDPFPLEKTLEYELLSQRKERSTNRDFIREFDESLEGRVSRFVSGTEKAEAVLAQSVRTALGLSAREVPDSVAIRWVLDPTHNPLLADTLNPITVDRMSQVLHHVSFTFHKKISHTADSQDQRHRTVLASRPILLRHFSGEPDWVLPYAITKIPEAQEIFERASTQAFETINRLLLDGVTEESAFYLLPNAFPIRMVSTGDLHSYHHKWKMRSCYNAQEEIFRATIDEITQVQQKYPLIGEHLRAPCYLRLRAKQTPYCPEGDHFCGLPVWNYSIDQYQRQSL